MAVSVVSLYFKGQDYGAAERLAQDYLRSQLPKFAEIQLGDLVDRIRLNEGQLTVREEDREIGRTGRPIHIPYVIDNQNHRLADILTGILQEHVGRSLDAASAYFTVGGFGLLQRGLERLGNFRLILGAEPTTGEQLGLRPAAGAIKGLIKGDLESLPFDE
jgi:hypothetical protein